MLNVEWLPASVSLFYEYWQVSLNLISLVFHSGKMREQLVMAETVEATTKRLG